MSWLGCLQCPWAVALSWGYLCHPWGVCISVGHKCHAQAVFIMLRLFSSCSCHPTAACVIPWLFMLSLGCLCDFFKRLFEFKNPFQSHKVFSNTSVDPPGLLLGCKLKTIITILCTSSRSVTKNIYTIFHLSSVIKIFILPPSDLIFEHLSIYLR